MTDEIPDINDLIDIRFPDGREFASRVEDVTDTTLSVAAPFGGGVEPPEIGSTVDLCWTGPRGQYRAPVRLLSIERSNVRSWTVELAGPVELAQRRRYVRATAAGEPVTIRVNESDVTVTGRAVDLSEGGLRCWVTEGEVAAGAQITVTIGLDDNQLAVNGEVLRVMERRTGKGLDIVIVFDLAEAAADIVRRYVMRAQLLARRLAADSAR